MNIDDPKFTAYALDALPPDEKEVCEPGVLADEEMLREAELTAAFAEKLKNAFTAETNARLSAAHWREIFAEAGVEQPADIVPFETVEEKRFPVWALSAAAGVMFGAVVASLAITWNDAPVLTADTPQRPPMKDAVNPEPVSAPQPAPAPAKESAPVAVATKKAPPTIVARPLVSPVVSNVEAQPPVDSEDSIIVDESESVAAIPEVVPVESPDGPMLAPEPALDEQPKNENAAVAAVQPVRSVPGNIPFIPSPRVVLPAPTVDLPRPAAVIAAAVTPAPSVAATLPPAASAADPAVEKKVSVFALNSPPAKKITVTIPNVDSRKTNDALTSVASSSSDAASGSIETQLDTLRLGSTLDDINAAGFAPAIPGYIATASGTVSVGIPFTISADSGVFVNVLLDNNGLPLWLTPGTTRVLDVSDPYTLKLQP